MTMAVRQFAWLSVAGLFLYLLNVVAINWFALPGWQESNGSIALGGGVLLAVAAWVWRSSKTPLRADAQRLSAISAYIVQAAFWSVLLVGLTDTVISFLRVENLLESMAGKALTTELGRAVFRGQWVHFPLIVLGFVIAGFNRSLGFVWLALWVVIAEFLIVISRFVFSYEQAFMGDLVRFWYAALFLFASSYTLLKEGHVRVDVLYAGFSQKTKSWANLLGALFLGLPLCWTILVQGLGTQGASLISPLKSFEISQSGYGLYIKYLMAGFLVIFAVTMAIQFASLILNSVANLREEPGRWDAATDDAISGEAAKADGGSH